jgi:hypothetical protein
MAVTYTDKGKEIINSIFTNNSAPADATIFLYSARGSATPTLMDLSENTEAGYAPITLNAGDWTVDGNEASFSGKEFSFTEAATITGWGLKIGSDLVFWNDLASQEVFDVAGGIIRINSFTQTIV